MGHHMATSAAQLTVVGTHPESHTGCILTNPGDFGSPVKYRLWIIFKNYQITLFCWKDFCFSVLWFLSCQLTAVPSKGRGSVILMLLYFVMGISHLLFSLLIYTLYLSLQNDNEKVGVKESNEFLELFIVLKQHDPLGQYLPHLV